MTRFSGSYLRQVRQLVVGLLALLPERPFAVRLPDGSTIDPVPEGRETTFTLVLKRPASLRRMFLPPSELAMGEGYIFDDFDIEGDTVAAFRFIDELELRRPSWFEVVRLAWQLWRLQRAGRQLPVEGQESGAGLDVYRGEGQRHSPDRDQQAVQFHYDLSNAFYKLWLDERLVYSCAYFPDGDESLDVAQERKLDLLCQTLELQPGERLLDVGCGWGGLVIYAASGYGAHALGITLSEAQAMEAADRISAAGLEDRCEVSVRHYEQVAAATPFDKVVSIGMFEHVGREKLPGYFERVHRLLPTDGLFLLQGGVARLDRRHAGRGWMDRLGLGRTAFMQKYSFPDSNLIDVPTVLANAERAGFEALKVASMRRHAVQTVRHWLAGLERSREAAVAEVGQAAYRCWMLIWAGYLHLLDEGRLSEYQFLLRKRGA